MRLFCRFILVCVLLVVFPLTVSAQGRLAGTVTDEAGVPLPSVVVKVYDETGSKMLTYAMTDVHGRYAVEVKQSVEKVMVRFNCMGFVQKECKVDKFGTQEHITLKEGQTEMKEVSVRAKPVVSHNDTISYNVARLKDKSDRTIEDVIKKIPGIEVEESGTIKYNGKPINKFYIEGADMLGGRYSLASKNIDAEDVATVSVYENHQPKRVLKDIAISDQAALNLKLKNGNMLRPIGNASVGAGLGDKALWQAGLFTLLVSPKKQYLVTLKGNNTAALYDDEAADYFSTSSSRNALVSDLLHPSLSGPSYISASRSCDNRSAITTYNSLHTLSKDVHLNVNGGYHYNHLDNRIDKASTFTTSDGVGVVVNENTRNSIGSHAGWLKLKYESNKDSAYVNEQLSAEGKLQDGECKIATSAPVRQYVKSANYLVTNHLEMIWRRNGHAYNFKSITSLGNSPKNMLDALTPGVSGGDSLIVSQNIDGLRFHNQESSYYKWALSHMVTLGVDGLFQLDYDKMNATMMHAADGTEMQYGGRQIQAEVAPSLGLRLNQDMNASINLVTQYGSLHYRDQISREDYRYDRPRVGLRTSFAYRIKQNVRLTCGASHLGTMGNMFNYVTIPLYLTYRDRSVLGSGRHDYKTKTTVNVNLNCHDVITGRNANLTAHYQHVHGNVSSGSDVSQNQTSTFYTQHGSNTDSWLIVANVSKNVYDWHTIFSLRGEMALNGAQMYRQNTFFRFHNDIYAVEGRLQSSILQQMLTVNVSAQYILSLQHGGLLTAPNRQNDYNMNAEVTLVPLSGWQVYLRCNASFIQKPSCDTSASRYNRHSYLDVGSQYAFKKFLLELSLRNVTNRRQYHVRQFSALDTYDYLYHLRPIEGVLTVRYNL